MNINFLVHDCFPEIGHTRAMLEVLRRMDRDELTKLRVICFTSARPEALLPGCPEKVDIVTIPFPNLKPFILKSLFFQLYTWIFQRRILLPDSKTITMGVCSFIGDIVNIQYSHIIWEQLYFKTIPTSPLKTIYKKVLLKYLSVCEGLYYKRKNLKFVFLSQFMADKIVQDFSIPKSNYTIAYSSADINSFGPNTDLDRNQLIQNAQEKYPELHKLNPEKPILLFVGAFERKGLPSIIDKVDDEVNFIIIGKGEKGGLFSIPKKPNYFHIEFTQEIELFFNIADTFIFPTAFEPFGLVVLEAYASGTKVLVTESMVGASELIKDSEGVEFISPNPEQLPKIEILDKQSRIENFNKRKEVLSHYTWESCAQKWAPFLLSDFSK